MSSGFLGASVRVRPAVARPLGSGFTLIEVLVALVILSTGIVLVLRAFDTSLFALGESRDELTAGAIMNEKLAETQLELRGETAGGVGTLGQRFSEPGGWYGEVDLQQDIVPMPPGTKQALHQVTLRVWRDGSSRVFETATYVRSVESPQ